MSETAALEPSLCLDFYRRLAGGVAVVTTRGPDGPVGSTVSTVTSVSLDPPLLLVSLATGSRTLAVLREQGLFALHLLHESRRGDATAFARHPWPPGHATDRQHPDEVLGVPILPSSLARTVCVVEDIRRYGDHQLVIGRMIEAAVGTGRPLLWHSGEFWGLERPAS
ncbi:flavin reductase family protein [Streptomyces sp. NPDC059010]|uniref:flavin reductase family protein n=1 Tax=Streptomyces sp. NPDC059010 TaxID=3346695 RepID=UPI0036924415